MSKLNVLLYIVFGSLAYVYGYSGLLFVLGLMAYFNISFFEIEGRK